MTNLHGLFKVLGIILFVIGMFAALLFESFSDIYVLFNLIAGMALLVAGFVVSPKRSSEQLQKEGAGLKGWMLRELSGLLILLLFLGAINIIAAGRDLSFDLTEEKVNSLSQKTIKLLEGVQGQVIVTVLSPEKASEKEWIKTLLGRFKKLQPDKFSFSFVSPFKEPLKVEKLGLKSGDRIQIEFRKGKEIRTARLSTADEQNLATAIYRLSFEEKTEVYYLSGTGEPDLMSTAPEGMKGFYQELANEGVIVKTLALETVEHLPESAAVILAAPVRSLSAEEQKKIIDYVRHGGSLLLLHDPGKSDSSIELGKSLGVQIGRDVIIAPEQRFHGADLWQVVTDSFGYHAITKNFGTSGKAVFLLASTVKFSGNNTDKSNFSCLVKSLKGSWGEKNLKKLFSEKPQASRSEEEPVGPLCLAVAGEKKMLNGKFSRIAIFGDSEWIKNHGIGVYQNRDLAINTMNWLMHRDQAIEIRPRSLSRSWKPVSAGMLRKLILFSLLIIELLIAVGVICWWRRRS